MRFYAKKILRRKRFSRQKLFAQKIFYAINKNFCFTPNIFLRVGEYFLTRQFFNIEFLKHIFNPKRFYHETSLARKILTVKILARKNFNKEFVFFWNLIFGIFCVKKSF